MTNSEIDELFVRFYERRQQIDEHEAFFECIRVLFPEAEGAEDDTKTWVRYSPKLGDEICRRIAVGEPIRSILHAKDKPSWNTIRRWMDKYPAFGEQYEKSMRHRADYIAHRMVELAGKAVDDPKNASGYKVAASILQWQAAMGNPKKYSERLITSEDHEPPKDLNQVVTEFDRICKELGVSASIFLEHKPE